MINKTVAVVDDDPMIREMYSVKLKHSGYDVVTFSDGQAAIKGLKKSKPDLVLLDIVMPIVDGIAVLEHLKKNKETKNIPVILLTNLDDAPIRKRGAEGGALYFLNKAQFLPRAVVDVVNEVFETEKSR